MTRFFAAITFHSFLKLAQLELLPLGRISFSGELSDISLQFQFQQDFGNPRGRITAALDDFIDLERSLLKQVEYCLQLSAQVLWKRALRRAPRFTATHHQLGCDFFHNIVYRLYQFRSLAT